MQIKPFYKRFLLAVVICVLGALNAVNAQEAEEAIDLIITNGRVIDPETGLDAIRDIVVSGGRIVSITETSIDVLDEQVLRINAQGLVVAPGFIDLHVHGQSD